jgi:hypothetical protein
MAAMQKQKKKQRGRIELNISGHHFQTSAQTLRRVPDTFVSIYYSGPTLQKYPQIPSGPCLRKLDT